MKKHNPSRIHRPATPGWRTALCPRRRPRGWWPHSYTAWPVAGARRFPETLKWWGYVMGYVIPTYTNWCLSGVPEKYGKLWIISSIPTWMWWGYVKNMKFSQSKWGIWRSPQTGRMWAEFSHIDVNYEKERIFVQRMNLHEWTYLCSAWICMNEHHPIHVVVFGSTIVTWLEFRSLNLNFETGDLIDLAKWT